MTIDNELRQQMTTMTTNYNYDDKLQLRVTMNYDDDKLQLRQQTTTTTKKVRKFLVFW